MECEAGPDDFCGPGWGLWVPPDRTAADSSALVEGADKSAGVFLLGDGGIGGGLHHWRGVVRPVFGSGVL